jgi:uncharacterized RDD family membrane protein YckC
MYYASWGQRVGGYLIDGLIVSVPAVFGAIISTATMQDGKASAFGLIAYLLFALISVVLGIYNRWILGGRTGQTWGRKVLNIRMVSGETGQPIGAGMAFVRDLCHILDTLACYVGWLNPLWDSRKRTFADKIMKTLVVPVR